MLIELTSTQGNKTMPTRNEETPDFASLHLLRSAGISRRDAMSNPGKIAWVEEKIEQGHRDPDSLIVELLQANRSAESDRHLCAKANEAAEKLNQLLKDMVEGDAELWHLHRVRQLPSGPRAVCQANGRLRELEIHPDLPLEELENLETWEYVSVHENAVVATWSGDPSLFADAHGEVVQFKAHIDRAAHLVEVSRNGHEEAVISLTESLWDEPLAPDSRLVLQRDNPRLAIALVKDEHPQCRFETPIDNLNLTLRDLAGIEEIAQRLIDDIMLRIYRTDIRDRFGVEPMRGILLTSYKPGMGKSKFVGAITRFLYDYRDELDYDVRLYEVKPNQFKSVWHGEDAKIVRELWGKIRARQTLPRTRPLIQIVVLDEIDSLGRRAGANDPVVSSAQSDALEAMLVEMDGLARCDTGDGPPAHVLCIGMTNRPDRVDDAAKRPGRFGDLVLEMPEVTIGGAESIMAIYARQETLSWYLEGKVQTDVGEHRIRSHFLRPALSSVFGAIVARYKTDTQRSVEVTAGQIMANVHFMDAVNSAKRRAAVRTCRNEGVPAVGYDDIVDCLLDSALGVAQQMEADPQMLIRHLQVKVPVTRVDAVPKQELAEHRYLRVHSA
jgi:ATP-dependent 26S proteasome regulatory subunit